VIYKFAYFRPLRTATWAILASACTFSAVSCNTFIGLSTWDLTKYSGIPPANTAAYVGIALAMLFSYLMIISGSIMEIDQPGSLPGGPAGDTPTAAGGVAALMSKISSAAGSLFTSVDLAKKAFFGCAALAFIGWALTLAGVASVQAYCSLQPEDMAKYELPLVYYLDGSAYMNCATIFSGNWWAWSLMTVTLLVIFVLVKTEELGRFKSAAWILLISSVTLNMYWIDVIIAWVLETDGTLRSRMQLWSAGYMIYEIAGYGLLFTGSAYIYATSSIGQNKNTRFGKSSEALATRLFVLLQALSVVALIIALVGMALYQHAMLNRVESQFVFSLRFTWTIWALSFVANVFLAVVWYSENEKVKRLKTAMWLVFISAAVSSMTINSFLYAALQDYTGDTLKWVKLNLAASVTWVAVTYLLIFVGEVATWERRHAADIETSGTAASAGSKLDSIHEDADQ
jgi:hypothetical protein